MDTYVDIFNLNGINLLGMQRIPRKRADNYVHKDQLEFWSYEGQEDEECAEFRRFRFRKDTVKVLAHLLDEDIGPKCESSTAFSSEQRLCWL